MLPVINRHCVEQAVRTGLGLERQDQSRLGVRPQELLLRRPAGGLSDQQYKQPIVGKGEIVLDMPDGATRKIGITRLHLEQDAGKSLHDQRSERDLCRSQPRRRRADGDRVRARHALAPRRPAPICKKLRAILRYLGTCDGNMEEGSLRGDVQCLGAAAGRPARHALRDQERQFRSASSCRRSSTRRAARSRSSRTAAPSIRRRGCSTRTRRDAADALQGRGA